MPNLTEVYDCLDQLAPFKLSLGFDNCGILINSNPDNIDSVMVSTDLTRDVVAQAKAANVQLIITHHPAFFKDVKSINYTEAAYDCIQAGISYISMHTNFDACVGGLNDYLSNLFGVQNTQRVPHVSEPHILISRIGTLDHTTNAVDLARHVCDALGTQTVRYNNVNRSINKVVVNSGGGSDMLQTAIALGADAIITGEVPHHLWLLAKNLDFLVIDAGHFETEHYTRVIICDYLNKFYPQINAIKAEETCPYIYL